MRAHFALDTKARPARFTERLAARAAVLVARLIAARPPYRIRALLLRLRAGAAPASYQQAEGARDAVMAISALCAGEGCVVRSLAVCLLCRLRGAWPTWRTGIRTAPFAAHAWVEAEGRMVGEPYPEDYFVVTMSVPPA